MTHRHSRLTFAFRLLIAMTGVAALSAQAVPPTYRITVIDKPGVNLSATQLNDAGQVSGYICLDECFHTFLYDNGVVTDIKPDFAVVNNRAMNSRGDIVGEWDNDVDRGVFAYIDGNFQTLPTGNFVPDSAAGINTSRQVAGNGHDSVDFSRRAFIWQQGGLSFIPNGPFASLDANRINNAGQVAGVGILPNSESRAFLYDDGETLDLGTIPGAVQILANLLSGTGIVAGFARMPDGTRQAVRSRDGAMVALGLIGNAAGNATAINNAGQLVGAMDTANGTRAFLHDGASLRNLGTLGGDFSNATAITDNGQIAGAASKAGGEVVGFIRGFGTDVMHDLNSLVDSADPLKTKMRVRGAYDVNEFGQIAALGRDTSNNKPRLLLLTPVDSTSPVVRSKLSGTKGTNGWFKSKVSLAWTVIDEEAPVGRTTGCGPASVTTDTRGRKFSCVAKSLGGTRTRSVTVKRDTTRPTATIARPAPGATFKRNQAVTASFSCSDATAGIRSCAGTIANGGRIDTSKKVTNATFSVKAIDGAGHTRTLSTFYSVN